MERGDKIQQTLTGELFLFQLLCKGTKYLIWEHDHSSVAIQHLFRMLCEFRLWFLPALKEI